jgi:NhaP-type Na+/H+ or K+/H+ antiporter
MGLSLAAALLLAAALAPTDPVLASDVQVGPPGDREEDEVRFTLTSEAGLNDGLAFPFVLLAIAFVQEGGFTSVAEWFAYAVVWKIAAGIGMGYLIGWVLGWLTFHLPNRAKLSRSASPALPMA